MKLKIAVFMLSLVLLTSGFGGCGNDNGKDNGEKIVASYIREDENGDISLYVDGKPFLYTAVEMRSEAYYNLKDIKTTEEYDKYFKAAADLGVTVVTCSLDWRDVEPNKDEYDFSHLRTFLGFAKKYDLKLELLWYSACMCAYSQEFQLPDYIIEDAKTYPRYAFSDGREYSEKQAAYYGKQYLLKLDCKEFLERESKVIAAMTDYIYEWEEAYGFPKVLIGVQVYNEVDLLLDEARQNSYGFYFADANTTPDKIWSELLVGMNNAGKGFKNGRYSVYTRTNFTSIKNGDYSGRTESSKFLDAYNLQYIDAVGMDPYVFDPMALTTLIRASKNLMKNNFTHFAENGGEYSNTDALIMLSLSQKCGYTIYELARCKGFPDVNNDQGILNPDLEDKYNSSTGNYTSHTTDNYTQRARGVLNALKSLSSVVTQAKTENFAVFNVLTPFAKENYSQQIMLSHVGVKFVTNSFACGFAIEYEGCLYLYSTAECRFEFTENSINEVFVSDNTGKDARWEKSEINGNVLSFGKDRIYKLSLTENVTYESTANDYKGY